MRLVTDRLILRPWRESDAGSLYEYASDERVGPFAGWNAHRSVEESREIIRTVLSAHDTFAVVPKDFGRPVGSVALVPGASARSKWEGKSGEIGYWIGVPFWGRGYIPEAVRELLKLGFTRRGLDTIWCGYYDGNEKSRRVQEKCGFIYHHTDEDVYCELIDAYRTERFTRITRAEWQKNSHK